MSFPDGTARSVDPLRDAARRTLEWLAGAWPPRSANGRLALEALALIRVCGVIDPRGEDAAGPVERAIARDHAAPCWTVGELSTSLLAAAASVRIGGDLAAGAIAYLDAFRELQEEGFLSGSGGALVELAIGGTSTLRPAAPVRCPIELPPGGSLDDALETIEGASRFGTAIVTTDPRAAIQLDGEAMAALRAYDLPRGMRILRARAYVASDASLGTRTGLDFLRLMQGDDGSFGDVDAAARRLEVAGEPDGALRLKLPLALQVLWTMAELDDPTFRLCASAFGGLHSIKSIGSSDAFRRAG